MLNITNNKILLIRYDIVQLMVMQNTINEIAQQLEPFVSQWIKNIENTKSVCVHIWVNELLFDILMTCKKDDLKSYYEAFKYQLTFESNSKMKDGEYKMYRIAIIVEDKYK